MISRITLLLLVILLVTDNITYAQNARAMRRRDARAMKKLGGDDGSSSTLSLGLNMGTTGLGIEARTVLSRGFNLRFGTSMLPYTYSRTVSVDAGRSTARASADLRLGKVHVLAEAKLAPVIRIVGGFGFFYQNYIKTYGQLVDGLELDGVELKPADVGELSVAIKWKKVAPYIGLGLFRDMPLGRFNVNADLGVYNMGTPESEWKATKMIAEYDMKEYKKILDGYIAPYKWLPVVNINLNYNLN
jgi:hypothetical protein